MALVIKDRVKELSTTAGTGAVTLLGSPTGYQTFTSAVGNGNTTYYAIVDNTSGDWEVGLGTYTSATTSLSRDTVLSSSNAGSLVTFSSNSKDVFVTYPASKGIYTDSAGNAIALGTPASATLTNATGLPISTGVSGLGTGIATFLATPSSANLATAVTDETGSGSLVFATSPTLVTPVLGTPSSGTLTSCTGYTYANLSGTVPTWNQNTTGTAAGLSSTLVVGSGGTGASTAFTTGSVVFAGASGTYSQDNANFFWDDTNNRLGIGTAAPATKLTINNNTALPSAGAITGTGLWQVGADVTVNAILLDAFGAGGSSTIVGRRSAGTATSPTALGANGTIVSISAYGYGATGYSSTSKASISLMSNEAWSDTAQGTRITFSTTANTTTTTSERMRIDDAGNVGIGTSAPTTKLTISANTALPSAGAITATNLWMVGADATSNNLTIDGFAGIPSINGRRAAGTAASPTAIASGATLLGIYGYGYGATGYSSAGRARIIFSASEAWTDTAQGSNINFGTNPIGSAGSPIERMRIDDAGNVGIGTTSPIAKLDVVGLGSNVGIFSRSSGTTSYGLLGSAANDYSTSFRYTGLVQFDSAATGTTAGISNASLGVLVFQNTSNALIYTNGATPIMFGTSATERMRIDSAGNVGIGTTPAYKLDVVSTAFIGSRLSASTGTNGVSQAYSNTGGAFSVGVDSSAGANFGAAYGAFLWHAGAYPILFGTSNTERMRIDSSGNVGIGTTSAATKLQVEFSSAGTTIAGSPVFTLKNTSFTNNCVTGVVAQNSAGGNAAGIDFINVNQVADGGGASGSIGLWTNNSGTKGYRIYADNSGNVGIGTTSPFTYGLSIAKTTGNSAGVRMLSGTAISDIVMNDGGGLYISNSSTTLPTQFYTNGSERMRIHSSGGVSIGNTTDPGLADLSVTGQVSIGTSANPTALLTLAAGTATANTAPIKFTSGTNLTTPEAGTVEYDGTIITASSNTNFKRGTVPLTNYTSGTGTALGTNTEATLAALLPAANDTITLSIGTYFIDTSFIVTRGASTTSATARLNILGTGTAAGNFSGMSLSAPTAGGATANFSFDGVNINVSNVLTAASTTSAGVYQISLRGILKVTTSGTIIPQYNLSANINGAGTVAKVLYLRLQQLDTQSAAASGPAGTGWA